MLPILLLLAAVGAADPAAGPRSITFDAALGLTAAGPEGPRYRARRRGESRTRPPHQLRSVQPPAHCDAGVAVRPARRAATRARRGDHPALELLGPTAAPAAKLSRSRSASFRAEARVAALASRLSAARAWINVWAAEHVLEETRREERIAAELERLVDRAAALGAMTRADLAEARAYHAEARVAVLNAEGEAFQSGLTLAREVGAPEALPLRAEGALPAAPVPSPAIRPDYLQRMNALPVVVLKDFQARAARARAVEEEAARGSIAQLGAILQRDAPGGLVISGIARVTFPVFDRGERERAGLQRRRDQAGRRARRRARRRPHRARGQLPRGGPHGATSCRCCATISPPQAERPPRRAGGSSRTAAPRCSKCCSRIEPRSWQPAGLWRMQGEHAWARVKLWLLATEVALPAPPAEASR